MGCGHSLVRNTTNKLIEKSMVLRLPQKEIIDKKGLVFEQIKKNNKICKQDIATECGLTIYEVEYAIKKLKKENRIIYEGHPCYGEWKIL